MIAIYKLNGKLLKTANLEKKLKKIRQPIDIIYKQEFTGSPKECEMLLDSVIAKMKPIEETDTEAILLHHYINKITNYTATSIYTNDTYLLNKGYEQID